MHAGRDRKAEKVKLIRRLAKGKGLCWFCIQHGSGKNTIARMRRGTC